MARYNRCLDLLECSHSQTLRQLRLRRTLLNGLVRCLVTPRLLDFIQTKEDTLLDRDGLGAASTRPVAPAMVSKLLYRILGRF